MFIDPAKRVFVALDTADLSRGVELSRVLKRHIGGIKIGKEFFTSHGPWGARKIIAEGVPVFLDLKFHDIPNTVARAVKVAADLGVWMLNVHASVSAILRCRKHRRKDRQRKF